jgi:hypothetical protein
VAAAGLGKSWGGEACFTPCAEAGSLLEAEAEIAMIAVSSGLALPSPAGSDSNQFRSHQQRGESLCQAVQSTGWGAPKGNPNMVGKTRDHRNAPRRREVNLSSFASGFF